MTNPVIVPATNFAEPGGDTTVAILIGPLAYAAAHAKLLLEGGARVYWKEKFSDDLQQIVNVENVA